MFLRLLTLMTFSLTVCAIAFGYSDNPQNDSRVAAPAALAPPGLSPGTPVGTPQGIYYDIVYVRAPRYGDDTNTRWPEVFDPIRMDPGADLVLLHRMVVKKSLSLEVMALLSIRTSLLMVSGFTLSNFTIYKQ